jgi:hypothetical protein
MVKDLAHSKLGVEFLFVSGSQLTTKTGHF